MRNMFILIFLFLSLDAKEIYATFDVVADKDAKLAFVASGIVAKVNVDVSSVVQKGDILAVLQNDDIKASLEMAKVALKYAKRSYERELKVKHLIDETKFDKVALAYENAKVTYEYKKALYDKTFLKAPFDGVIYKKDIEVGDAVSAMTLQKVFYIQSVKKRKLILYFDQKYVEDVKAGDIFSFTLNTKEKVYKRPITKIYPFANYANRKASAQVMIKGVTPGIFGDGYISTKEK